MKHYLQILLFVTFISVTFSNCKKDKVKGCTDPSATNYNPNAEENDGSCVYPAPDPCAGITCLNGGTCSNGVCQCPQGYTGTYCENQVTPLKVTVSKITVTGFCQSCDPDDTYPDIYVKLKNGGSTLYTAGSYYPDATSPGNYEFVPPIPLDLNPLATFTMELWDYDTISDDLINSANFTVYSSTGGFPTVITITSGQFVFKLNVTYTF